jgi:selenium metabolism protein YedF
MRVEVNAIGLACPKPVILAKKELDKLENGIVRISVDNDISKQNVEKLAMSLGCEVEVIKEESNLIVIDIKKGENIIIEEQSNNIEELEDACFLIGSDTLGDGERELGEILMKGFIYTLTETKPYPKYILLINEGVKLTTENKATIDHLKVLEAAGVEVLSCGLCLDYYKVVDKLSVGSVTNMYVIVETMKKVSKVINL